MPKITIKMEKQNVDTNITSQWHCWKNFNKRL